MTFDHLYSRYYDLFYIEKKYEEEVNYVIDIIRKNNVSNNTILELGCGTGNHAEFFAKNRFDLTGVDLSEEMLTIARSRFESHKNLRFEQGNIETYKTDRRFDIVLSLFHVVSYVNSNSGLLNTFRNVYNHLTDDGIFVFDCWYGPGVLSDQPEVRIKEVQNQNVEITRIAQPTMHYEQNVCEIDYKIYIRNKADQAIVQGNEKHNMRYFFVPEMHLLLEQCNLKLVNCYEYLTFNNPTGNTWNAVFVCKRA